MPVGGFVGKGLFLRSEVGGSSPAWVVTDDEGGWDGCGVVECV